MSNVADNLARLLAEKQMSSDELGRLTGNTDGRYIRYIRAGRKHPSREKIQQLADALDVTFEELTRLPDLRHHPR